MLIVEGTDCVGKTTLITRLLKELEVRKYPVIPQHFGILPAGWDYYKDYLPFMNTRTVMDRFIISEIVYSLTLRNRTVLTPELYRRLDAHLRLQGSVTVVILADDDWLSVHLDDVMGTRQEVFNKQQILAVNNGFRDLVHNRGKFNNYAVDIDIVYRIGIDGPTPCTMPSSDDEFVQRIVNAFIARQEANRWIGTY